MANQITTNLGKEKIAKAHYDGSVVPKIVQVGWGNAGVDGGGNVIQPSPTQTIVPGEFIRKDVDSVVHPVELDPTKTKFVISLEASEPGVLGEAVSSCGLYDQAGTLVALRNFAAIVMEPERKIDINWLTEY